MFWMELFEILVNGFLSSVNVVRNFVLEFFASVLDPILKKNIETIYLFDLIFKFACESYILLNLNLIIYWLSRKYFKS